MAGIQSSMGLLSEQFGQPSNMLGRGDDDDRRSESDNFEALSNDNDGDASDRSSSRRKKYHRHTPSQIQELENFFKECPHPDEKQRMELGRRLGLESRQVKFWFQNRRTQLKTQVERHENILLKQEYDKLRLENLALKEAMGNPLCKNCGGPNLPNTSIDGHLRLENSRLKDELSRVLAITERLIGKPITTYVDSNLHLSVGSNCLGGLIGGPNSMGNMENGVLIPNGTHAPILTSEYEKSIYLQVAMAAMEELVTLAQSDGPLWYKTMDGGKEAFNYEEYLKKFEPYVGMKPAGFITNATRETATIMINSLELVDSFMSRGRWAELFPTMIGKASTLEVLCPSMGESHDGKLQLMNAEFLFLSPSVPLWRGRFIRFSKQQSEGLWVLVDVSIDNIREHSYGDTMKCRRLPSGCIVQDPGNGCSLVTWIEHVEYDENSVHHLYRPLLRSALGFGAQRWLAVLQRQCECRAFLSSFKTTPEDVAVGITSEGKRSIVNVAKRMIANFCAGISASSVRQWQKLQLDKVAHDVRVMMRVNMDEPGEPSGVVLSAATSVWIPIPRQQLFDFLRDDQSRGKWDILSNGGPMLEVARIPKGPDGVNCITLLCPPAVPARESNMLILQESWTDQTGCLVVYAPVDVPTMQVMMNGGDPNYLALLPSGFAISDALIDSDTARNGGGTTPGGSLLTLGFQILVDSIPNAKLSMESIETVSSLITCTVQKIKVALNCN
ncbi:hypothetical protein Ancab_009620 [Ancistrocladus abbreviatus]